MVAQLGGTAWWHNLNKHTNIVLRVNRIWEDQEVFIIETLCFMVYTLVVLMEYMVSLSMTLYAGVWWNGEAPGREGELPGGEGLAPNREERIPDMEVNSKK